MRARSQSRAVAVGEAEAVAIAGGGAVRGTGGAVQVEVAGPNPPPGPDLAQGLAAVRVHFYQGGSRALGADPESWHTGANCQLNAKCSIRLDKSRGAILYLANENG